MLSVRIFCSVFVIGIGLKLCYGQCLDTSRDMNTKWRAADVLEQLGHDVYQSLESGRTLAEPDWGATAALPDILPPSSLALGPFDVGDPEKRFFSIYGHALYQYLISDVPGEVERIRDAVHKTRKQLANTADVLAGPMRGVISLVFNIVELPLTDVQLACPYTACEDDCQRNLAQLQSQKMKICPGYKYNIALYKAAIDSVTSCPFQNLLKDLLVAVEKGTDNSALDFFTSTFQYKYPEAARLFKIVYNTMRSIPVSQTCNMFSFL